MGFDMTAGGRGWMKAIALALVTMATLGLSAAAASADPADILAIEQDGRAVPVANGVATLSRRPFTLTLVLTPAGAVDVSASMDRAGYDLARAGRPLDSVFQRYGGIAEADGNAARTLYLRPGAEPGHHVWDVLADRPHRFDGVSPLGPRLLGRRTVDSFTLDRVRQGIETWSGGDVFLVYRSGDAAGREDGRAAVRLVFPPLLPSARAKPAATPAVPTFSTTTTVVGVARPILTIGSHSVSRADFGQVFRRYQRYNAHLARTDPSLALTPGGIVADVVCDELALADARRLGIDVSADETEAIFLRGAAVQAGRALDPASARARVVATFPTLTYDEIIESGRRVLLLQRVAAVVMKDVPAEQKQDLRRAYMADAFRRLRPIIDRDELMAMYADKP